MDIEHFNKVGEFNTLMEHPCNVEIQFDIFDHKKIVDLRLKLIEEEFKELVKAIKEHDIVEVIDGVCDILYVVYGMMHVFGFKYEDETDYCRKYDGVRKPSAFEFTETSLMIEKIGHRYQKISSVCNTLTNSKYLKNDMDLVKETLCEIYDDLDIIAELCYEIGYAFGFDVDKGFNIVHDSNMSKACKTEDEAKDSIKFIKENGVWKDPTYKLSKDGKFYILLNEHGKILKSINYKPADFSNLNIEV